jgi:(S)-mandelate dehydrogenase
MKIENAINITDLEKMARRRLPKVIYDYMAGGAEDERTLHRNRQAFEEYRFQPRMLSGVNKVDLSTSLFGDQLKLPFIIGPTGLNGIHWKDGDRALARAAAAAGTSFVLSTASNCSIESVAASSTGSKWFQLYPWGDRAVVGRLIERAKACGYRALLVTVDSLIAGKRERDLRNRFSHEVKLTPRVILDGIMHPRWLYSVWLAGGMPRFENIAEFLPPGATASELAEFTRSQRNPKLTWDDIAWIKDQWKGPMAVKGILAAEDAQEAARYGIEGVVISNHGGRQLDGSDSPLDALPAITRTAGNRLVVLIDGGFRRGTDIVKALALGADGVLLGRATLFGLASGGEAGARKALTILADEVSRTMSLLGCETVGKLGPSYLSVPGLNIMHTENAVVELCRNESIYRARSVSC